MNPIFLQYPEVTMGHISTLRLHRLRYGELRPDEEAEVMLHLSDCETCSSRLSAQENHRAAFELMPVPAAIQATSTPSLWQRLSRGWLLAPALVAALSLFVLSPATRPGVNTKGASDIEILVEDLGVFALDEGDVIRPGDRIQLRIPPGEWVEVWVGDGTAWLGGFPVTPSETWQLVPFSLEVDEAPGPEQLVVLLTNHPLSEDEALEALSDDDRSGIVVHAIALPKEL
jgi:hypothetical protein